jgi:hypothetical protein
MPLIQTPPPTILPNYNPASANLSNYSGYPADAQIAVSNTHLVVTARAVIAFYDKSGGLIRPPISTRSFFSILDLEREFGIDYYYDTRIIFDSYRNRFWIGALTYNSAHSQDADRHDVFVIAVSKTDNPLDSWYLYWWDAVAHYRIANEPVFQRGDSADYPSLGIDSSCIYQTNGVKNIITDIYRYWRVIFFPANAMANGSSNVNGWQFWDLANPDSSPAGVVQPVICHGFSPRAYFVSKWGNNAILIWGLNNPLQSNQQLNRASVILSPFTFPPNAPQKDSTQLIQMDNLNNDPLKAVYRKDMLYLVMNDARDWFRDNSPTDSIRLLRVNVSNYPNISTSPASGFINRIFGANNPIEDLPKTHMYYGWPAVEVNKDGNMAIVYTRSGTTIYPEMRYSAYYSGEQDIRPSRLVKSGEASYTRNSNPQILAWGDTAGISVDPSDDKTIWIAHQYASVNTANNINGNFEVWIARVF